jgi:hypothetical protein
MYEATKSQTGGKEVRILQQTLLLFQVILEKEIL